MKILILSHTRRVSNFKIGSHHYANGLSNTDEVEYMGLPYTFLHKIAGKKNDGVDQLNKKVKDLKAVFLLPITMRKNPLVIILNKIYLKAYFCFSRNYFDCIICDSPYFSPYIDVIPHGKLIYRPTDIYEKMDGEKINEYEEDILDKCDAIIATSDVVLKYLTDKYYTILERKTKNVVYNGYDEFLFNTLNAPQKRDGAIYIGALDKRFDFEALDILASSFPDDKFDIYGPVDPEFKQKVDNISMKRKNILFHGAVSYEQTPGLLKKHCVGLLLLKDNDLNRGRSPMKLWEYISCGLSVLYGVVEVEDKYKKINALVKYKCIDDLPQKYLIAKESYHVKENINLKEHSWTFKVNQIKELLITKQC
ncbi:hypothetical protein ABLU56_13665 [Klebsiella sp. GN_Kp186]|uniref:hypothetical protein n=1 Tax=Klebsiella TaxID=570 RepID=UPI001FAB6A0B|nr:hypothetical protein [Klebsiella pneumoniae]MCI8062649.1 hypothetical protein [Klebsiella pneumoniae]MDE4703274.1 hypothetical protein [Klebsiella pneumoniae]HBW7409781.1 glycosyltransferase family 4 protein [Klebsiella pneumoniae]HBW7940297.1 glycosyltransferase family 4 protein [Klebsiella pneumoniae]